MKVMSTMMSPAIARDHVKPAAARQPSLTPTTATAAEATAPVAAKTAVPSGLERVLERLQSNPAESLNRGQANALQHIERNIARYRDHHGIVDPATLPTAPATTPVETPEAPVAADPAASETPPATTTAAPVETPAETPVAPVTATGEVPAEAPVDVAAVPVASPVSPTPDLTAVAAAVAPPPAVSLVESIPPAGSLIDVQA